MSKGSKRRPTKVSNATLAENWKRAFEPETAADVRNAQRDALIDMCRDSGATNEEIEAILEERGL